MHANVSADRGAVAAGRDVVADLIVTGDRNTFFLGGYQRLSEAYIDPGDVLERVDVERFVGRAALIAELDAFLAGNPCGYFVIEAAAGMGKTALLAHLVATRGWVHHFSELAPGETGIASARMSLAAQLIRAYDLRDTGAGAEPVLSEAAASRPDFLRALLRDAAAVLAAGEKLVIVVDALDEAGTRPGESVLGLPRVLPDGVFAVVSKRTVAVDLHTESPRHVARIEADSEDNRADIRAHLVAHAPPELVEPLLERSHGVWVYVRYALRAGVLDPDTLPDGLWAWYHRFWSRWAAAHAADWRRVHLPLLATLAAAREELTVAELCDLAGVDPAPDDLPAEWRAYLIVRRERPRRHRLYHASFSDFLHGRTTTEDSAEQDFADDLGEATRAAHDRIADRHLAAWGGLADGLPAIGGDPYGLAHVPAHLRRAERRDELFALVDAPAWREAQLLRDPSAGGFLGSVTEAWDCAVEADRAALEAGERPPYLRREIASALTAEDVHTYAAYLPPVLLARLVAARIWSPDQALAAVGLSPYPYGRALSLAALLPLLPEPKREAEVRAFLASGPSDGERVLHALAPHIPAALMPDAVRLAAGLEQGADRAEALEALAPHAPGALHGDLLVQALGIEESHRRVEALTALLPCLGAELRDQALEAALEAIAEAADGVVASWAGRLYAGLAGAAPERLLALAGAIKEPDARAEALAAIAPHLDGPGRSGALAAAIASDREALEVLVPHLPLELGPAAADTAAAIEDPSERARALAALAPLLPPRRRPEPLAMAPDPDTLADVIVALAPHLDDAQHAEALEAAIGLDDPSNRSWALRMLFPHLPDALRQQAADEADALPTEWDRDRALSSMEADLAHEERQAREHDEGDDGPPTAEALADAIAAAAALDEADPREEALAELVPRLPDAMLPDAVRAALAPWEVEERAQLWAQLDDRRDAEPPPAEPQPPPLPAGERAPALAAAEALEDAGDRARALAEVGARIPAGERFGDVAAAFERAIDHAAATLRSRRLGRALRAMAPVLPPLLLPHAFAVGSRIPRRRFRKYVWQDVSADMRTAPPLVQHRCLDIALRAAVEHLDVPTCARSVLPIVDRLDDEGGGPWRPC